MLLHIVEAQLHGGTVATSCAAARVLVRSAIDKFLRGEGAVGIPICNFVPCAEHRRRCDRPTRSASALVRDFLQRLELLPLYVLWERSGQCRDVLVPTVHRGRSPCCRSEDPPATQAERPFHR